ncbi:hypothetical protein QGM71_12145 [Virgibacillus sp. C22-A2]|uniref:Uncharacterized protein n=1 Tax=Virgibacillus tibetensis TaxID=3042313 RepID=A0ABU6KG01_9BACI|nr:hypothetical protein [Virgibacillus sp. C22-A2]
MNNIIELKERLAELNNQTNNFVDEFKKLLPMNPRHQLSPSLLGYFTHSINVTTEKKEESILFGGFHIKNLSANTINDLYLCLRIDTVNQYDFSGKFRSESSSLKSQAMEVTWERFNNSDDEKELWFRLGEDKQLNPFEKISFPDFHLTWENKDPFSCSIVGFVYSEYEKDGVPSSNTINLKIQK